MTHQNVFVIWTNPLFYKSVRLVLKHPQVSIVGSTSNYSGAAKKIGALRPDTILIEKSQRMHPEAVLELLDACSWNVQVVLLSLEDNHLRLYQREQKSVDRAEDLLMTILHNPGKLEEE